MEFLQHDTSLARRIATKSLIVSVYNRTCAWCGEPIVGRAFECHHWHIKRSGETHAHYAYINVVLNVVPLHHSCHATYGQTTEMHDRCMQFVEGLFGAQIISDWEESLRKERR